MRSQLRLLNGSIVNECMIGSAIMLTFCMVSDAFAAGYHGRVLFFSRAPKTLGEGLEAVSCSCSSCLVQRLLVCRQHAELLMHLRVYSNASLSELEGSWRGVSERERQRSAIESAVCMMVACCCVLRESALAGCGYASDLLVAHCTQASIPCGQLSAGAS